jgi:hypothetical protein
MQNILADLFHYEREPVFWMWFVCDDFARLAIFTLVAHFFFATQ